MLRGVRCGAFLAMLASGCSFQIAAEGGASGDASGDGAPFDAAIGGVIDAPVIDGPAFDAAVIIDAAPIPCTTAGLVCPGGTTPLIIPCAFAGECWVGCRDGNAVNYAAARGLCTTWGGRLGWITNPLEEACLRNTIDGAISLGLVQAQSSGLPGLGWTWSGEIAWYINWAIGQPNDGDGFENNTEQCAYSSTPSATWHDEPCTVAHSRFTCRR